MILTCPQCGARYNLPAETLSAQGKRVKCTSCGQIWRQIPYEREEEEAEKPEEFDIPEGIKPSREFPQDIPRQRISGSSRTVSEGVEGDFPAARRNGYIAAFVFFAAVTSGFVFMQDSIIRALPTMNGLYMTMGMNAAPPGEGLAFDRISARFGKGAEGGHVVQVEGYIVNLTSSTRIIPQTEAVFRTYEGKEFGRQAIELPQAAVPDEDSVALKVLLPIPESPLIAKEVVIRFVAEDGEAKTEEVPIAPAAEAPPKTGAEGGGSNPAHHPDG